MEKAQDYPSLLIRLYEDQVKFLNSQIDQLKTFAAGQPLSSGEKTKKSKKEKSDRPKRAPSAYNLFMMDRMKSLRDDGVPHKDMMTLISKEWNSLDAQKKSGYSERADKLKHSGAEEAPVVQTSKPKAPAVSSSNLMKPPATVSAENSKPPATPVADKSSPEDATETDKKKKKKKKKHHSDDHEHKVTNLSPA